MKRLSGFIFLLFFCVSSYASSRRDTLNASLMNIFPNKEIVINKDIDLRGKVLPLPKGVTLNFKGGVLKNGVLLGNNTKIKCKKKAFDHIEIKGSWNVPKIYSSWFKDLNYVNALQNVIALTNSKMKNRVYIGKGNYSMMAEKDHQICLQIKSNTDLIIDGIIRLLPNTFAHYYILYISGSNINISGNGMIVGDKHSHKGTNGEWGMGINLKKAKNVSISGLTVKDCWGDCIYIGNNSENILVEKCTLDHGRRQGISITSGNQIILQDLKITNVSGTKPQYGIDVEPNKDEMVDNVFMKNISIDHCMGGILINGKTNEKGTTVGSIVINDCKISKTSLVPIKVKKCKDVKITGCTFTDFSYQQAIVYERVGKIYENNNSIRK